jgi:hypothetical protein
MLLLPALAIGYSSGPLDHFCADPPDFQNCTACHSSFPVNSGSGSLELLGIPSSYTPGTVYDLTVDLSQTGPTRWGFEITVIKADGVRGGQLEVVNVVQTQLSANATYNRDFMKHTTAGTFAGQTSSASWPIRWTAPVIGTGPVTFYLAGNAANNSSTNQGDYIYTINVTVPEVVNGIVGPPYRQPESLEILTAYPNPFNPDVTLNLAAQPGEEVQIELMDVSGRRLDIFTLNAGSGGTMHLPLNLDYLPSGLYFARAYTRQGQSVITLVKSK